MVKEITNPISYKPLQELVVCSNKIIDKGHIIGVGEFAPLIIGVGLIPSVWIYTKVQNYNWLPLVIESRSNHIKIKVTADTSERKVSINMEGTKILTAQMVDYDRCIVADLDLRPIGLNFYGDSNGLIAGSTTFNSNSFNNVAFMIGLDES